MLDTIIPDLEKYTKVRSTDGGCTGCRFKHKVDGKFVKCSAIQCHPYPDRPYPVIYKEKI